MAKIDIRTLNCGVKVIMEKIPYVQSAAIGIWCKVGAVDETPKLSGASHFIEHMMFKGTEERNARRIAEDIDKIGGQINAFTGKEATCYYVKTIADNLTKGMDVLFDMLNNSVFDSHEMTKERQVICEEIKMIEDQPDDLVLDTATELAFKNHPLGKTIIGTPTSLRGISRKTLMEYKNSQYTRDSIVISIAGNINEDKICEYLENKFEKIGPSKEERPTVICNQNIGSKVIVKDIQQSHICLSRRSIKMTDDRYYAFAILNNIMGGSMSSRLFQNIREEKGLAYSVYSMNNAFSHEGLFSIYAGVSHDKIKHAIEGIDEELLILKRDGITSEEMNASKEQLKSNYIFGQENVASRMFSLGKNLLLTGKVYTPEEIISEVNNVTMDDIEQAKQIICNLSDYSVAVVTDKRIYIKDVMRG